MVNTRIPARVTRTLALLAFTLSMASAARAGSDPPGVERSVVVKPIVPAAPGASEPAPMPHAEPPVGADVPAPSADPTAPRVNVRDVFKFAIGGEFGWNSLAGLGVNFSYHPIPYLALDAGAGLGLIGWKGGARVRVNFFTSEWSPIVAAGYIFAPGTGDDEAPEATLDGESVTYRVRPSSFIQAVAGVNYTGINRWVCMLTAGYAFLLRENIEYVEGSKAALEKVEPFLHGGVVISGSLGYAF